MMLNILWSIIIGFGVFFFSVMAESLFEHEGFIQKSVENGVTVRKFRLASADGWLRPILLGVAVGGLTFLGVTFKMTTFFGVVMLIGLFAVVCYLVYWWQKDGNKLKEFAAMSVVVFLTAVAMWWVAACVKAPIQNSGWRSLIGVVPIVVFVIAIAIMAYFGLRSYAEEKEGSNMGSVAMVVLIIGIIIAALTLGFGVKWQNFFTKAVVTPVATATAAPEPYEYPHYFNAELQTNETVADDYDFGPNPYKDGKTVADYVTEFKTRVMYDPALGAGDMAYYDAVLGTRVLGTFYQECQEHWALTINKAKEAFIKDRALYKQVLEPWFKALDKAKADVQYVESGLDDQMYMYPDTVDGVPDVIVMETLDHGGWFLVFTFTIKEQEFKVGYRINCGYQPTNVSDLMGIPLTSRTPPQDDNPPSPSEPTPTPYHKDPNDRAPTIGDDDPGPGPDTNNPDDPWHSTEDQPDNSNHMPYEEYREKMDELAEINDHQRVAGDPNTPTVTPAPDTVLVDSNADKGTGYGGADDATPESRPAKEENGDTIVNANTGDDDSKAGTQWSGPKD